jgi:hypothetical protein
MTSYVQQPPYVLTTVAAVGTAALAVFVWNSLKARKADAK